MIPLLKKVGMYMLAMGLLCLVVSMPAFAETNSEWESQQEISVRDESSDVAAAQTATTEVTAYIEAEPAPQTPVEPQSPTSGQTSSPTTGDKSSDPIYMLLLCMTTALLFCCALLLRTTSRACGTESSDSSKTPFI